MTLDALSDSAGPSSSPPPLPEGWLAQWEGIQRKWYFVQRTTGKSQWELPKEPVVLTPSTTPTSIGTGPSRAPSSRLEKSIRSTIESGDWPTTTTADGAYDARTPGGAGYSSLLLQGNDQRNEASSAALGMLGQHPGAVGHHAFNNQVPFGYSTAAQTGPYAGVGPQYNPLGQMNTGGFGFQQTPNAASPHTVGQNIPSSSYSPSQPQWHIGQQQRQQSVPLARPASNRAGSVDSKGPVLENPLSRSHHQSPVHAGGFPHQYQGQNLAQGPFGSPSPKDPSVQQSHYPPVMPAAAIKSIETLPPGTGVSYPSHYTRGTPDSVPGYAMSQPSLQPAASAPQPLRYNNNAFQDPYSQVTQQAPYPAGPPYPGYIPGQARTQATSPGHEHLRDASIPAPNLDHYGMPYVPPGLHASGLNHPNPPWGPPYPDSVAPLPRAPSMDGYGSIPPRGPIPHNYPAYQAQPNPGLARASYVAPGPGWVTGPGLAPGRSAVSDPQFISGPWASGLPPPDPGMMYAPPYRGGMGYRG